MNSDENDYRELQRIFLEAVERRAPEDRKAYLDEACGNDSSRRAALEALLKEFEEGESVTVDRCDDPAVRSAAMFVPGTILADRYRIVTLLGRGGMGEVYRADDLKLEQAVALKFLPPALAQDRRLLKALYNEVRLARQVSHRHVGRVYDIGEAEGLHFLSMEYIQGEDLGSLLRRIGRLPSDKAIALGCQLCAGLQAAHEEGLLHLDLKPGNLMIDGRGDLRITDFGLARLASEAEAEKRRAGTPAYMAPEQLLEGSATVQSDLYAVGLILYEMVTGKRYHTGRTAKDMVTWHQTAQHPPPSLDSLPAEIGELIRRCAARDPAQRPESIGALLAVLESLQQGDSPTAAPETREPASEELKFSDVFINYAPLDNKPLVPGKPGWIEQFHDHLQVRLEQLSGENVKIWRHVSPSSEAPDAETLKHLPEVKTMVSVVSPPFVKAPLCLKEMDAFWRGAERSGTFRVSDKTRILKVVKTPVPAGVAPPDVELLMAQLAGFDFFETDEDTGRILAFDETFGERAMQRYFERVYDLAYEIRDVLQALGVQGVPGGDGKTIYLAETTIDLLPDRDKLKRELLENGHRVVPELPLPLSGPEFEKEVALLLEEADFAVHLVGARYGMAPEDTQHSVVELQNALAAKRSAHHGLDRLIWMPRGVKPRDERQASFIKALIEDPKAHRRAEVVRDSLENFKDLLLETLAPADEAPEVVSPARRHAKDGKVPSIYLIYDRRDEAAVEPLEDLLFELGFEVIIPCVDSREEEAARIHQHNLQHCDAALVFYGSVSKPWVDMKLMDVAQAPGYGRSKDFLAKAVYVTSSEDRRKARYRTHLAEVIRSEEPTIDNAAVQAFASRIQPTLAG